MCTGNCAASKRKASALRMAQESGTVVVALMPKFGCPLCWPVLTAVLGVFGVQVKALNTFFAVLAAASLIFACIGWYRARQKTQFMMLGLASALLLAVRLSWLTSDAAYLAASLVAVDLFLRHGSALLARVLRFRGLECLSLRFTDASASLPDRILQDAPTVST